MFSTGWCPEMELLCQLSQLKPSIRDLVYHIRVCKTSVSQHGCFPPPSSFLTSGLLTSSIAMETYESTRNDLHICLDVDTEFLLIRFVLIYFQNKLNL